jgi:hypothetical protein
MASQSKGTLWYHPEQEYRAGFFHKPNPVKITYFKVISQALLNDVME